MIPSWSQSRPVEPLALPYSRHLEADAAAHPLLWFPDLQQAHAAASFDRFYSELHAGCGWVTWGCGCRP